MNEKIMWIQDIENEDSRLFAGTAIGLITDNRDHTDFFVVRFSDETAATLNNNRFYGYCKVKQAMPYNKEVAIEQGLIPRDSSSEAEA